MTKMAEGKLLTVADVASPGASVPAWQAEALEAFCETIEETEKLFPCFFARRALTAETLRFVFLEDSEDERCLDEFARALASYAGVCRELAPYTAFVALFAPQPEGSLEDVGQRFWRVLQWLHDHDPGPWPEEIPPDPDEQLWEFCFSGEPLFVLGSSPAYSVRRSRTTDTFTISFQPRYMFDKLIDEPEKLARARAIIRRRVLLFDGLEVHPMINMYHEEGNREWRQYWVPDDNRPILGGCPLRSHASPGETA